MKDKNFKYMIASDLHGSSYYCKRMLEVYVREEADSLILLGDLLYHGPRNELPKDYNPKLVADLLNEKKEELLCVQGNCDAQVDQMILQFPMMADYALIHVDGYTIFITHGHNHNKENLPCLKKGSILLHGHTHIQAMENNGHYWYLNPGSVSIPKEGNENSYMIYEKGRFTIKNLEGKTIDFVEIERNKEE